MSAKIDDIINSLETTHVSLSGISFAGKSLKLDTENDAKPVIDAINSTNNLEYLNLEGNTLGVDASKAIATALEKHPEFKKALWKDMFTGRMKTEIPKALQFLGNGLVTAGARLTELDLSDNAFGPIGVEGLAALLRSSSCYALEELRLNNNGLGISGGKLLASALISCYNSSKNASSKPLALKVFVAGRNRLENEGAKALAQVFKLIGSLEEISMPQNGIYHVGISALAESFNYNKNLQVLNLNDNTVTEEGAKSLSNVLGNLKNLRKINFGDCLLKTNGAILLANSLKLDHENLEELNFSYNEINKNGGIEIAKAIDNKSKLRSLIIDGNCFGNQGRNEIKQILKDTGKFNVLGSLDEDESSDDEEIDKKSDDSHTESEEDLEEQDDDIEDDETNENYNDDDLIIEEPVHNLIITKTVTIEDFLKIPSADNFLALGANRRDLILREAKKNGEISLEDYIPILMKVSALSSNKSESVAECALELSESLYEILFKWSEDTNSVSLVNNILLVNLALIKNEDKFKPQWNLEGCLTALNSVITKSYIPETTKNCLKLFMKREIDRNGDFVLIKKKLLENL